MIFKHLSSEKSIKFLRGECAADHVARLCNLDT